MTELTVEGKLYRISPTGLVWAAYTRPSQPEQGVLWRRMQRGSIRSSRVLEAAGLINSKPASSTRLTRQRLYAIDF